MTNCRRLKISPLPRQKKKLESYGIAKENLNKIYLLPFKATKYKLRIIHNILATNSILYKMKKVVPPSDSQTIRHFFISCTQASSIWNKFQNWSLIVSSANSPISELDILFGITRPCKHCLALNHLIMLGKYFLYVNALNNIKYDFNDFVSLVQEKVELEKYITACL